jgi:hypothetical protein
MVCSFGIIWCSLCLIPVFIEYKIDYQKVGKIKDSALSIIARQILLISILGAIWMTSAYFLLKK